MTHPGVYWELCCDKWPKHYKFYLIPFESPRNTLPPLLLFYKPIVFWLQYQFDLNIQHNVFSWKAKLQGSKLFQSVILVRFYMVGGGGGRQKQRQTDRESERMNFCVGRNWDNLKLLISLVPETNNSVKITRTQEQSTEDLLCQFIKKEIPQTIHDSHWVCIPLNPVPKKPFSYDTIK